MSRVDVDYVSVHRSWKAAGFGDFWVQLQTASGTEAAFVRVLDEVSEPDGLMAEFATRSPTGYVTQISGPNEGDDLDDWLARTAQALSDAGFIGNITGTREARSPTWMSSKYHFEPAAFISWAINPAAFAGPRRGTERWNVPAAATEEICDHLADWLIAGGRDVIVKRSVFGFAVSEEASIGPILASAVTGTGLAAAIRFNRRVQGGRLTRLDTGGEGVAQIVGQQPDGVHRAEQLRDLISSLPGPVNQACIRTAVRNARWIGMAYQPAFPAVTELEVRYNKHLLDRYVPDAHGIQVLTAAHLANAADLSRWHITSLDQERHLVEASDLRPWYDEPFPEPQTLEQARHDFGPMILTTDTLRANPPPDAA